MLQGTRKFFRCKLGIDYEGVLGSGPLECSNSNFGPRAQALMPGRAGPPGDRLQRRPGPAAAAAAARRRLLARTGVVLTTDPPLTEARPDAA